MAFQSEFQNNPKLKDTALYDKDHVGLMYSPKGTHVLLIKKALNAWASKKGVKPLLDATSDVYDTLTADRVALYKNNQVPKILNYKQEIDNIVGIKTIAALDKELPPANKTDPSDIVLLKKFDLIIYISGKADANDFGGKPLAQGDSGEFDDVIKLGPKSGRTLEKRGFGGSLENNFGMRRTVEHIKAASLIPDHRIVLYGYSAGAKQLLQACRNIEFDNAAAGKLDMPNILRPIPMHVDLLITLDAAAGFGEVNRTVAGCVRRNVNFFQTSSSLGGSHGAPNNPEMGVEGIRPDVDNRPLDGELKETFTTKRHDKINEIAHPRAMDEIRKFIAS